VKKTNKPNKPFVSDKEYLETHLEGMDEVKKKWYTNAMKTWTNQDYNNYAKFHLWMFEWEPERGGQEGEEESKEEGKEGKK
jgi:hypothetical protein